jgi:hypothetical protein
LKSVLSPACLILNSFKFYKNEPSRGKPLGIFKGNFNFIAAPLGGISASLQQAAGNLSL